MSRRIIKSRITDYRPPGAGASSPLDRGNAGPRAVAYRQPNAALDALGAMRAKEAAEHDRNVAGLSMDATLGAFEAMRRQKVSNPKSFDERWIAARFGALARRLMHLKGAAA